MTPFWISTAHLSFNLPFFGEGSFIFPGVYLNWVSKWNQRWFQLNSMAEHGERRVLLFRKLFLCLSNKFHSNQLNAPSDWSTLYNTSWLKEGDQQLNIGAEGSKAKLNSVSSLKQFCIMTLTCLRGHISVRRFKDGDGFESPWVSYLL